MHPVQAAAMAQEAESIEKCRNDPSVAAAGLCPVCMMYLPCWCDRQVTLGKMRSYYEANRRVDKCRTLMCGAVAREEPEDIGSWGVKYDALMGKLYEIAIDNHKKELAKRPRK